MFHQLCKYIFFTPVSFRVIAALRLLQLSTAVTVAVLFARLTILFSKYNGVSSH